VPFRESWLIVGGVLVLLGFAVSEPAITAVGFVIVIVGAIARYWSRHLFDRVRFVPTLSERRAFADEPVTLSVELENRKPLPLPWYEWRLTLADPVRLEGEHLGAEAAPGLSWLARRGSMGWYERRNWDFTARATERGYHQVGGATLRSADLFGVFPRTLELPAQERLTVYPRVFTLAELGLPADRPFGERKGGSPIFEDPLRFAGLREFRPGDPLKRIDWKATARSGDLVSRVYDPSATQQLYVCLNIDTMTHAWEGYLKDELEHAVSVAASVAVWAAGARYSVGLLANGAFPDADRPIRLAPSRSNDQLPKVLEALAVIQPLTMGDLAGALHRESNRLPEGSTIVLVASLIPDPLAAMIVRLHEDRHRVFVLATSERALGVLPRPIPIQAISRPAEFSRPT
jgi:uncharacterized protein (DUF58 family)